MESHPKISWDNNHYNYINILYSTIKYFSSKQINNFHLCGYIPNVKQRNMISWVIFSEKINQGRGQHQHSPLPIHVHGVVPSTGITV
jgi:hypothetical protein